MANNRGKVAFQKKKKKYKELDHYHLRCSVCAGVHKRIDIINGLCPICRKRKGLID